jgi:hypothetical protein
MHGHPIATDATVEDIVGRLNAATEYVRRLSEHMWECRREFGMASVRIGVTGAGRAPNYRIEYIKDGDQLPSIFGVYNGLSHRKVEDLGEPAPVDPDVLFGDKEPDPNAPTNPDRFLRGEHWSTRVVSLDEVAVMLGNLRQRKR